MSLATDALEDRLEKIRRLEENLVFRFTIVNKILESQVTEMIAGTGPNLTGYPVLRITDIFESISISDLSRQLVVDRGQISRTATGLGKMGLITFEAEPGNKRKKMVVLSKQGHAMMEQLNPEFTAQRDYIEKVIGSNATPGLWEAIENLSRMSTNFEDN